MKPDLVVAGAGMAGLAAAAHARSLGARVMLLEKGDRPGGSLILSSGVIWRHTDFEAFRADCPDGDPALQRLVFERLDADVAWLESLGARVVERATANPRTTGMRFDTASVVEALLATAGVEPRLGEPLRELPGDGTPVVLATGGFQADRGLVREHVTPEADHLLLRAAPWSTGDGLRLGLAAGAALSAGMDEVYGRNMPAPPARVGERDFAPLAQLYAHEAEVVNESGERFATSTWSEIDVLQWTARQPRARAWFRLPEERLQGEVAERVAAAERAGAPVRRENGALVVETVAGITTTLGGLRVDAHAQAAPGVFACGTDVGGVATGGYASGLGAALVLGRVAATAALGVT